MKRTIIFLTVFAFMVLMPLSFSISYAQVPFPNFDVHVYTTSCSGDLAGAKVTITHLLGTETRTTDANGWAYFTAPIGPVHVKVTLPWDGCTGYEGDHS